MSIQQGLMMGVLTKAAFVEPKQVFIFQIDEICLIQACVCSL